MIAPKCTGAVGGVYDSMGACEAADCPVHRKARHTPGPWSGGRECVNGPDGSLLAAVQFVGVNGGPIPVEEGHANSRLMAAAPELLSALKRVLEHHGYSPNGPDFPDAWAAIDKAEGRIP